MWTKFGLKLQKNFEMRTSGGGGGVVSDFGRPRTRGEGGVKKGQIFADVLYGWPLSNVLCEQNCFLMRHLLHFQGVENWQTT